jgi:hypothetical protein
MVVKEIDSADVDWIHLGRDQGSVVGSSKLQIILRLHLCKRQRIFRLAERLSAFQEALYFMWLLSYAQTVAA